MALKSSFSGKKWEAGIDEAGRGCLAGPVVAAAVILPVRFRHNLLNDSKLLMHKDRMDLRKMILEKAIAWGIGIIDNNIIDDVNILNATFIAMHQAVHKLKQQPSLLLVDGNRFKPYEGIRHECIIGGDGLYFSIAAASILAKTERDMMMMELHEQYPRYGWATNKGYSTLEHRNAISMHGLTPYHRKSFRTDRQMTIKF